MHKDEVTPPVAKEMNEDCNCSDNLQKVIRGE